MAASDPPPVLESDELRSVDQRLLEFLSEGRVTPVYCRLKLAKEHDMEYSRGYIQQRLQRFEEHDHAQNLFGVGLYELTTDPRGNKHE